MDNVATREACLTTCQAAEGCNAVIYWADGTRCFLKQVSEDSAPVSQTGYEVYHICEAAGELILRQLMCTVVS